MMVVIIALMQAAAQQVAQQVPQQAASSGAFFTNDIVGILKLAAALGTLGAGIIAAVWKIMSGKLTEADCDLQEQVNGVGARVDAEKTARIDLTAKLDGVRERVAAQEIRHDTMNRDIGELKAKVEQMINQGSANKTEIINAFNVRAESIQNSVHLIDKGLGEVRATMNERERIRALSDSNR